MLLSEIKIGMYNKIPITSLYDFVTLYHGTLRIYFYINNDNLIGYYAVHNKSSNWSNDPEVTLIVTGTIPKDFIQYDKKINKSILIFGGLGNDMHCTSDYGLYNALFRELNRIKNERFFNTPLNIYDFLNEILSEHIISYLSLDYDSLNNIYKVFYVGNEFKLVSLKQVDINKAKKYTKIFKNEFSELDIKGNYEISIIDADIQNAYKNNEVKKLLTLYKKWRKLPKPNKLKEKIILKDEGGIYDLMSEVNKTSVCTLQVHCIKSLGKYFTQGKSYKIVKKYNNIIGLIDNTNELFWLTLSGHISLNNYHDFFKTRET